MDLENLFVSDLLDTLVGATDDRSTTLAIGEEGDEPEPPQDTVIEPDPIVTSDALGEEGDQPEDHWETETDPGPNYPDYQPEDHWEGPDESEPEGFDPPLDQGIWAGEDGNEGGCVVDEDDTGDLPESEPTDEWSPDDGCRPVDESEPADESDEPAETVDPGLQCW